MLEDNRQIDSFAVSQNFDRVRFVDGQPLDNPLQTAWAADRFSVQRQHNITGLQLRGAAGRFREYLGNDRAFANLQIKVSGQIVSHRLNRDPDERSLHFVVFDQLLNDPPGHAARHREADTVEPSATRGNRRVDADHVAVQIQQWPAAVSGIDCRISL